VWAYAESGQVIASVPDTITAQNIAFIYQQQIVEQPVDYRRVKVQKVFH
jgi:hypothetical protein